MKERGKQRREMIQILVWWMVMALFAWARDGYCNVDGIKQYHMVAIGADEVVVRAKEGAHTNEALSMLIHKKVKALPFSLFSSSILVRTYQDIQNYDSVLKIRYEGVEVVPGSKCSLWAILSVSYKSSIAGQLWTGSDHLFHEIMLTGEAGMESGAMKAYTATMNLVGKIRDEKCKLIESKLEGKSVGQHEQLHVVEGLMKKLDVVQISGKTRVSLSGGTENAEKVNISLGVYVSDEPTSILLITRPFIHDNIKIYFKPQYVPEIPQDSRNWPIPVVKLSSDLRSVIISTMKKALRKVNTEDKPMVRMAMGKEEKHYVAQWNARGMSVTDGAVVDAKIIYSDKAWTIASGPLTDMVHFIGSVMVGKLDHEIPAITITTTEDGISATLFASYMPDIDQHRYTYVVLEATISYN